MIRQTEFLKIPENVVALCERLQASASAVDQAGVWPQEQLDWCNQAGVFRWFIPAEFGGLGWSEDRILAGYLALAQSCLATTFVLTQWNAACKRILGSENSRLQMELLPKLARGEVFATVGISQLTTSRQHVRQPVLTAERRSTGFELNGHSPWVTSAAAADVLVLGAVLDDQRQLICAVPGDAAGVSARPGCNLVALTASCTDQVDLDHVFIEDDRVIAGPVPNVMQTNSGGGAGGLQTSTLAVGLSQSAIGFLAEQVVQRSDLQPIVDKLSADCGQLVRGLFDLTVGNPAQLQPGELRQKANSLVLRSTQAALTAAKGAGFLAEHQTGRWAREALFFLVWSCPQPVASANLCELAQITA